MLLCHVPVQFFFMVLSGVFEKTNEKKWHLAHTQYDFQILRIQPELLHGTPVKQQLSVGFFRF